MAQLSGVNAPEYRNAVAEALDIAKSREPGAIGKPKTFFQNLKMTMDSKCYCKSI